jgi:hypothetical protein
VGAEALDADLPGGLSDDGPDGPGAQLRSFQRTHNVDWRLREPGGDSVAAKESCRRSRPESSRPFGTEHTKQAIAQQFGVSKNTIDRIVGPERLQDKASSGHIDSF